MRIFVSYNKADRLWAEWIAWHVEQEGHSAVIQAWDFAPGNNFVLKMHGAIADCDCTILVLSPDFLASPFTAAEWAGSFASDPTGDSRAILPIRVRECDLSGLLSQIVYLNLVGVPEDAARELLKGALAQRRSKPSTAPAFPATAPVASPQLIEERADDDLAWYVDPHSAAHVEMIDLLGFSTSPSAEEIRSRWEANEARPLEVLLGVGPGDRRVALDLVVDGPVIYVHGHSGTGTSTLLRGMALSLASTYSPSRVKLGFMGRHAGSIFHDLDRMPHVVAHFLAGDDPERVGEFLQRELRRRMSLLEAAGSSELGAYNRERRQAGEATLPFFVMLVDESHGGPMLDVLARAQRLGRALGFGLVVAVQNIHVLSSEFLSMARSSIHLGRFDRGDVAEVRDVDRWIVRASEASNAGRYRPGRGVLLNQGVRASVFQTADLDWGRHEFDSTFLTSPTVESIVAAAVSAMDVPAVE